MLSVVGALPNVGYVPITETTRLLDELLEEYTRPRRPGQRDIPTPRVGAAHWCGVINYMMAVVDNVNHPHRAAVKAEDVLDLLEEYLTTQ
jgi:hypothetical protein